MTHLNVQQQQMTATSGAKENSLWPFVRFINWYFYNNCQQLFKSTSLCSVSCFFSCYSSSSIFKDWLVWSGRITLSQKRDFEFGWFHSWHRGSSFFLKEHKITARRSLGFMSQCTAHWMKETEPGLQATADINSHSFNCRDTELSHTLTQCSM